MYRWNGACSISNRCTGQYGTFSGDQRSDKVCISRLNHRTDQCFRPGGHLRTAWNYHSSNGNPCGILHSDSLFYHLGVWQHRANIRRLANGTENKIGAKKKEQK